MGVKTQGTIENAPRLDSIQEPTPHSTAFLKKIVIHLNWNDAIPNQNQSQVCTCMESSTPYIDFIFVLRPHHYILLPFLFIEKAKHTNSPHLTHKPTALNWLMNGLVTSTLY